MYNQSRNGNKGKWATNAKGGQSYHNYGLANDVFEIKNGQMVSGNVSKITEIGQNNGFYWGGNFGDPPHYEMAFGYTWQQLLEKYNKGDFDTEGFVNI